MIKYTHYFFQVIQHYLTLSIDGRLFHVRNFLFTLLLSTIVFCPQQPEAQVIKQIDDYVGFQRIIPNIATGGWHTLSDDEIIDVIILAEGYTCDPDDATCDAAHGEYNFDTDALDLWYNKILDSVTGIRPYTEFSAAFRVWTVFYESAERASPDRGSYFKTKAACNSEGKECSLDLSGGWWNDDTGDNAVFRSRLYDAINAVNTPSGTINTSTYSDQLSNTRFAGVHRNLVVVFLVLGYQTTAKTDVARYGGFWDVVLGYDDNEPVPVALGQGYSHEFSHAFGYLADEYIDVRGGISTLSDPLPAERSVFNLSNLTHGSDPETYTKARCDLPWAHIAPGGLYNPNMRSLVGNLFAGGHGKEKNVWHSEYTCLMNGGHKNYFCNREESGIGDAVAVWYQNDGARNNINASYYTAGSSWETPKLIETGAGEAYSPDIAMDKSGTAVAVWQQNTGGRNDIWANVYLNGSWGAAQIIETDNRGSALSPKVAIDGSGKAVAVWMQSDGTRNNIWANIYAGGWGIEQLIETNNTGAASSPEVAMDESGHAVVVWQQSTGSRNDIWANVYNGTTWGAGRRIDKSDTGNDYYPKVAMNGNGNALVVWYHYETLRNVLAVTYSGGSWGTPKLIETNDTGHAYYPEVAMNSSGAAVAVWYQYSGSRSDIWANVYSGTGWGKERLIETDNAGSASYPLVAMDGNGNAVAVWQQSDGSRYNIRSNTYSGGTWGSPVLVETDNAASAFSPQITMDRTGDAIAVWYQGDGMRDNIWANFYTAADGWATARLIETDNAGHARRPRAAIGISGRYAYIRDHQHFCFWCEEIVAIRILEKTRQFGTEEPSDAVGRAWFNTWESTLRNRYYQRFDIPSEIEKRDACYDLMTGKPCPPEHPNCADACEDIFHRNNPNMYRPACIHECSIRDVGNAVFFQSTAGPVQNGSRKYPYGDIDTALSVSQAQCTAPHLLVIKPGSYPSPFTKNPANEFNMISDGCSTVSMGE